VLAHASVFPLQAFERCEEEYDRISNESEMEPDEGRHVQQGRPLETDEARAAQSSLAGSVRDELMETQSRKRMRSCAHSLVGTIAASQGGATAGSCGLHQAVLENQR